jgi:hypothetical protein
MVGTPITRDPVPTLPRWGATKSRVKMWNRAASEMRELFWLVSMAAGLSAVGVSLAVALAIVLTKPF